MSGQSSVQMEDSSNKGESKPSTNDFVKKLYKILEDPTFQSVVSWGPHGDCFFVKDVNEFTHSVLPHVFKHSNFASFVRQLNKYDFHKVKISDDSEFGEHSWAFHHPDFKADGRGALENIRRKVPPKRKSHSPVHESSPTTPSTHNHRSPSPYPLPSTSHLPLSHSQQKVPSCELTSIYTQLSDVHNHLTSLQSQISSLSLQNNSLSSQLHTLSDQRSLLDSENTQLRSECSILRREISGLRADFAGVKADVGVCKRDNELLQENCGAARREIGYLICSSGAGSSSASVDSALGLGVSSEGAVEVEVRDLRGKVGVLEMGMQEVLTQMIEFQKGISKQDGIVKNLDEWYLGTTESRNNEDTM